MGKEAIRERVWDALSDAGVARFPFPPHGRIPNFAGAEDAADRVCSLDAWEGAGAVKINPDSPQRPVRKRALEAGKVVYMAVPRLRDEACFLRLDSADIDDIDHATTLSGSAEVGVPVHPSAVDPIDVFISGSVAVTMEGDRIGKGEGYSDLEYAILREVGAVDRETVTVTTVHELQLIDEAITPDAHDVPLDCIVTPDRTVVSSEDRKKPTGVLWDAISEEQFEEIPVLNWLREQ